MSLISVFWVFFFTVVPLHFWKVHVFINNFNEVNITSYFWVASHCIVVCTPDSWLWQVCRWMNGWREWSTLSSYWENTLEENREGDLFLDIIAPFDFLTVINHVTSSGAINKLYLTTWQSTCIPAVSSMLSTPLSLKQSCCGAFREKRTFFEKSVLSDDLSLNCLNVLMYSRQRYNALFPPFSKAPPTLRAASVIGPVWVQCRHRSRRPFICSHGRWTLHLINNEGNFSILQPICGHRVEILLPLVLCQSFAALSRNPALHWTLFERLVGELLRCSFVRRAGDSGAGFNKDACGVFVRGFLDRLTFFVGRKSDGNATVQDSWEGWNCRREARGGCTFTHQDERTGKLNTSLWTTVVVLVGGKRGHNWCVTGLTEWRLAAQVWKRWKYVLF